MLVCLILLSVLFGLYVSAEENIYSKNSTLITAKVAEMDNVKNTYVSMDTSDNSSVALKTNKKIVFYQTKLLALSTDPRVSTEDLTAEINLYYSQGIASGALAWIYENNIMSLSGTCKDSVDNVYNGLLDEVAQMSSADIVEYNHESLCTKLTVSVYENKINMLYDPETDSAVIIAIAATAKDNIRRLSEGSLTGTSYEEIYQKADADITSERMRESIQKELRTVYDLIYGAGKYDACSASDENIIQFLDSISSGTSADEFNEAFLSCLSAVLDNFDGTDAGIRAKNYIAALRVSVSEAVEEANALGVTAKVSDIFTDFITDYSKNSAMDTIEKYASDKTGGAPSAEMSALVSYYTAQDGPIGLAGSTAEISVQTDKAKARIDLLLLYDSYVKETSDFWGTYDSTEAMEKLRTEYNAADDGMKNAGSTEELDTLYNAADTVFASLLVQSEVDVFNLKHSYIIGVDTEAIAITDKTALINAMNDADLLSSGAKDKLSDTISELDRKYRKLTEKIIYAGIGTDAYGEPVAERLNAVTEYLTALGKLTPSDMADLISSADALLYRAEAALAVRTVYDEIISGNGYPDFSDENKNSLSSLLQKGFSDIRNAGADESQTLEDKLCEIKDRTVLAMRREWGSAYIGTLIKPDDSEAVRAIAEEARQTVISETDGDKIASEVDAAILAMEKQRASEQIDIAAAEAVEKINSFANLTAEENSAALNAVNTAAEAAKNNINGAVNTDGVLSALNSGRASISAVPSDAAVRDLENARSAAEKAVRDAYGLYDSDDYYTEKYQTITKIKDDALAELASASDKEEFSSIRDRAISGMSQVTDKLTDAKTEALERLRLSYERLKSDADKYSDENINRIDAYYAQTVIDIESVKDISRADEVLTMADDGILLMDSVRISWTNTSDGNLSEDTPNSVDYEGKHSLTGAYWGVVISENGMPNGTVLSAKGITIDRGIVRIFNQALKDGNYIAADGTLASSADIKKILSDSEVKALIEICLMNSDAVYDEFSGTYTVRLLIPEELRSTNNLRIVYVSDSGALEYYDAVRDGNYLVFSTVHFSDFIITGEKSVSLLWLIVLLLIILAAEVIFIIVFTLVTRKDVLNRKNVMAVVPVSAALAVITPAGAIPLVTVLSILVIALGIYIGVIVAARLRREKPDAVSESAENNESVNREEEPIFSDEDQANVNSDFADDEPHDIDDEMVRTLENIADGDDDNKIIISGVDVYEEPDEFVEAESPVSEPEVFESITAEDADTRVSDDDAKQLIENAYIDDEVYSGSKKGTVNLDTISAAFGCGDVVSLNTLKEKKLIPQNVGYVKILARGSIDKPLTLKAQSFSVQAVKMLVLTGGKAILTNGASCFAQHSGKIIGG